MAGTVVVTEQTFGVIKKVTFAWTSDAAGNADGVTTKIYDGKIEALATVPAGGGTAPTDLYDVIVADDDNFDVTVAAGQNRSSTVIQQVLSSSMGVVASQKLTLHVTNAGNAKQGTVYVYVR